MTGTIWKAPTHYKMMMMGFTVIFPAICFSITWYYLDSGADLGDNGILLPGVFGLVSMVMGLKDALTVERITVTDNRISYRKLSTKASIPFSEITRVYFIHIRARLALIEAADRKYITIYGAEIGDSISCADKFSEKDQKYIRKILRRKQQEYGYEIVKQDIYSKEDLKEMFRYIIERDQFEKGGKTGKKGKGGTKKKFSMTGGYDVRSGGAQGDYETASQEYPCPYCGQPLTFVDEYNQWYCYSCNQYL